MSEQSSVRTSQLALEVCRPCWAELWAFLPDRSIVSSLKPGSLVQIKLQSLCLTDRESFAESFRLLASPNKSWRCSQFSSLRVCQNLENPRTLYGLHPALFNPQAFVHWAVYQRGSGKQWLLLHSVSLLWTPLLSRPPLFPCSPLNSHVKEGDLRDKKTLCSFPAGKCSLLCFDTIGFHLRHASHQVPHSRSAQSPSDLRLHQPDALSNKLPWLKTESCPLVSRYSRWQRLGKGSIVGWPDLSLLLPARSGSYKTHIYTQLYRLTAWMCRWLVLYKSYLYLLYAIEIKHNLYKNGSGTILCKAPPLKVL